MRARLVARLRCERGTTLMELMTSMAILGVIITSLSTLLVSATTSEADMNRRFQAQTQARLGLDRLRREIHCAVSVSPVGAASTITLTIPATCPTSGGLTSITWCTKANGSSWELWRYGGGLCSGTGRKFAEYLTQASVFTFTAQSTSKLATLNVVLPVNVKPSVPRLLYKLDDDIVLRNSTRT